ncbi:hypothetical protein M404DRAFT_994775 [Pisolithus tinctorius Marx 270]|uniref:Uncharacterized protein n=1 Tax=Pisolithus tinctorius Marx 270 TaxID=870435 RepID=A0A0C3PR88_PISTI|nr:hypothetical protein M404DRAFT_994775 [Pisolithus tinctorius Marx 270]
MDLMVPAVLSKTAAKRAFYRLPPGSYLTVTIKIWIPQLMPCAFLPTLKPRLRCSHTIYNVLSTLN